MVRGYLTSGFSSVRESIRLEELIKPCINPWYNVASSEFISIPKESASSMTRATLGKLAPVGIVFLLVLLLSKMKKLGKVIDWSDKWELITAARLDYHDQLQEEGLQFGPKIGIFLAASNNLFCRSAPFAVSS